MKILQIIWNPDPILFQLGSLEVRWYSFFWIVALVSGAWMVNTIFVKKKFSEDDFNRLFVYSFLGIFIGARLGHCLFYDADYFLKHPLEIILPVHFYPNGDWEFTGYAGLASHGGTLGLIIALILYCRKTKIPFLQIVDIMAIAAPLSAGFIRIANLMNSEIIGMPASLPWSFIFVQVDNVPRHPTQLYEAIAYFIIFGTILFLYKHIHKYKNGLFFGICIFSIFTFRFFVEFIKERQVEFEETLPIDMGQILSIPFIIIGIYFIVRGLKPLVTINANSTRWRH